MRTAIKVEVEKNELNQVSNRFVYVTITPSKKETIQQAHDLAEDMNAYFTQELSNISFSVEQFEDDQVTIEFGNVEDMDDVRDIKDVYSMFKQGERAEVEVSAPTTEAPTTMTTVLDFLNDNTVNPIDMYGTIDFDGMTGHEMDALEAQDNYKADNVTYDDLERIAIDVHKCKSANMKQVQEIQEHYKNSPLLRYYQIISDIVNEMAYTTLDRKDLETVLKDEYHIFQTCYNFLIDTEIIYNKENIKIIKEYKGEVFYTIFTLTGIGATYQHQAI